MTNSRFIIYEFKTRLGDYYEIFDTTTNLKVKEVKSGQSKQQFTAEEADALKAKLDRMHENALAGVTRATLGDSR